MDSFRAFRSALAQGHPPLELFEKPSAPKPPIDAAIWRFLKSWSDSGTLGPDQAVLFRQVARWGPEGMHVQNLPDYFRDWLSKCSVSINASGIVSTGSFVPTWIKDDVLPSTGIDAIPDYRQDRRRLDAEHYVSTLQRKSNEGTVTGFESWKSVAQKEGAWLSITAAPGSTNLVVLPTGMGKSLCFQLLPLFSSGLTVVVVPTIALAIDQCTIAKEAFTTRTDVNPQYFSANDPNIDPAVVVDLINQGRTRLVFTSPEACVSGRLHHCLDTAAANGFLENLVLDEAHLVSSWGIYFRVDFQLLAGLRRKWKLTTQNRLRTFMYTATITPAQKCDLFNLYTDSNSTADEFLFHSLRPELSYYDRCFEFENQQQRAMEECLWHLPRPAIVYTTKVASAESLYAQIRGLGFNRVACFTGNTKAFDRRDLLDRWRRDELDLMVATSAFGLGVDKPDVRAVVHCCLPEDLNRYYQEVGRGGRDGYSAVSVLIPTVNDINDAKKMNPKLLSTELLQQRWEALWDTKEAVNPDKYEWKIRLNSKRPALLGDRTYQENIKWNQRLVLQLSRHGKIEITDLSIDSELSKELGEFQKYVTIRIKDNFNPDSFKIGASIHDERKEEAEASRRGFESLQEHLNSRRCISRILKALYGEDTLRCCGGCRWCRNEDREPTEPPVFEYECGRKTEDVTVVEGCEHPLTGRKRVFGKVIRKFFEAGVRRFACASQFHSDLLRVFAKALGPQSLYRLDEVNSGQEFKLLRPERLVVFHLDPPSRSLFAVSGASELTHVLCGQLGYQDIRYLLPPFVSNPKHCANVELWN